MERNYYYDSGDTMKSASIPFSLYKSLQGRYFSGLSRIEFIPGNFGWAGLVNPKNSDINIHINFFSVENVSGIPLSFQVWLNPILFSGDAKYSDMLSPTNTAYRPIPTSRIQFLYSEDAKEEPEGGIMIYGRNVAPEAIIELQKDGRYVCPPGGSFVINCLANTSAPEGSNDKVKVKIAFEWWEDRL